MSIEKTQMEIEIFGQEEKNERQKNSPQTITSVRNDKMANQNIYVKIMFLQNSHHKLSKKLLNTDSLK